jgi:lauroyl/myristoyl acyltransferase
MRGDADAAAPRRAEPRSGRLWCAGDLAVLAKLPPAALVAWLLPPRRWDGIAAVASGTGSQQRAGGDATARSDEAALRANRLVAQLQYLRSYRSEGWAEELRVEGQEHLRAALAAGKGAILWVMPFVFAPLVAKRSLAAAGVGIHHVSRVGHGFSPTLLGRRVLNPIWTRVERRYLAERIVLPLEGVTPAATRHLVDLLHGNRVISITLGGNGAQIAHVPGFGRTLRVATGAPNLALRHGAALLPVSSVRTAPGRFLTTIEAPLRTEATSGSRQVAVGALVEGMIARVEATARSWPGQVDLEALLSPTAAER